METVLFYDYTFTVMAGGDIYFDNEIKPEQLHVKDGDNFVVSVIDGKVVFKKKLASCV